jgi:hypothetical protein
MVGGSLPLGKAAKRKAAIRPFIKRTAHLGRTLSPFVRVAPAKASH